MVLADDGTIRKRDLPDLKMYDDSLQSPEEIKSLKDIRQNAEEKYIRSILAMCSGNVSEAARLMDISRRHLFNKLVEYDIKH